MAQGNTVRYGSPEGLNFSVTESAAGGIAIMGNANISDSDIQNALDALNENINGQSDKFLQMHQGVYPKTPDIFAALRGVGNLEFRLARLTPVNPNCDTCTPTPTNGIVRVQSEYTNGTEPNNLVKTLSYWNSYQYLNIWVVSKINSNKKIIGVGETGLDFYYNNSDKKGKVSSFINHIEASIDLDIPIIVHSRNAEIETYDILSNYKNKNLKILMHCFTGSLKFAFKLLDLNAFFSASGIITFKKSLELQDTFKNLPLEKLLIETDSPFLAPDPFRGKKNEPSFIVYTLNKLAQVKKIKAEVLDKITTDNFNKLFF